MENEWDLRFISEILKIDKLCSGYEADIALCVPNTIINKANETISHKKLVIGAQNCHHDESAYTYAMFQQKCLKMLVLK